MITKFLCLLVFFRTGFKIPILRKDCVLSNKGGKRAEMDKRELTLHPCWCDGERFHCRDKKSGQVIADSCPTDGNAECIANSPYREVHLPLRVDATRDCDYAQRAACTINNPCTPCEVTRALEFGLAPIGPFAVGSSTNRETGLMEQPGLNRTGTWKRCVTCSPQARGDCNFIEGVGPYCYESPGSRRAVPCKKCCTEGVRVLAGDMCG
jgi:hypothetical protein